MKKSRPTSIPKVWLTRESESTITVCAGFAAGIGGINFAIDEDGVRECSTSIAKLSSNFSFASKKLSVIRDFRADDRDSCVGPSPEDDDRGPLLPLVFLTNRRSTSKQNLMVFKEKSEH